MAIAALSAIERCPICSKILSESFWLCDTPLEDNYLPTPSDRQNYPLNLKKCDDCVHLCLDRVIQVELSYANYLYTSETTIGLKRHYEEYAISIMHMFDSVGQHKVLDIGCNDGSMLLPFHDSGWVAIGVEPAPEPCRLARQNKLTVFNEYFDSSLATSLKTNFSAFDVITSNYMFANVPDIKTFALNVRSVLAQEGVWVIQTGYFPLQFGKGMFDYVYHEHLHYFTIQSIAKLCELSDLRVFDIEAVPEFKGGSVRVYICKSSSKIPRSNSVDFWLDQERSAGIGSTSSFARFHNQFLAAREEFFRKFESIKSQYDVIVAFGASHSVTVFLEFYGLGKEVVCLIDDNVAKQGLYSPVSNLRVLAPDEFFDLHRGQNVLVILAAWQHASAILDRHFKSNCSWIVPLPSVELIVR